MKVRKLVIDYEYDFDLVGISSSAKDFKLAWSINNKLNIRLIKAPDYELKYGEGEKIVITNYLFETEHSIFRLFKNKAVEAAVTPRAYMVPEMPHFDYFAMIKGVVNVYDTDGVIAHLRKVDVIQYITQLDINKLKSKENFLF